MPFWEALTLEPSKMREHAQRLAAATALTGNTYAKIGIHFLRDLPIKRYKTNMKEAARPIKSPYTVACNRKHGCEPLDAFRVSGVSTKDLDEWVGCTSGEDTFLGDFSARKQIYNL